jgi:hypothetical protein
VTDPVPHTVYTVREVEPFRDHPNAFHTVKGCRGAARELLVVTDPRYPNFSVFPVLSNGRFGTYSLRKCFLCCKEERRQEGVTTLPQYPGRL